MTKLLYVVSLAAALSACATANSGSPVATAPVSRPLDPASCALDAYAPTKVAPYYDDEQAQKTTVHRLHGADLFIAARPGLTAEWLRRELAPRPGAAGCALGVATAEVTVVSDGPGFRVTIHARDAAAAAEILRLARVHQA